MDQAYLIELLTFLLVEEKNGANAARSDRASQYIERLRVIDPSSVLLGGAR